MIEGISHITLIVKDLAKTAALLESVLGANPIYDSGSAQFSLSREMFFMVGQTWLCLMEGGPLPTRTYNHIAFQIPDALYDTYRAKILASGAELLPGRPRVDGEGRSLYFYDFDNHLFELHTGTLAQRLARYNQ